MVGPPQKDASTTKAAAGCGTGHPANTHIFSVNNHGAMTRVNLLKDGGIQYGGGSKSHGWISLSGIKYATTHLKFLPLSSAHWRHYNAPNGQWSPAQYSCQNGLVSVTGLVKPTNHHGWGQVIGTLPVGCRPKQILIFTANNHDRQARMDVLPDGKIKWVAGGRHHGYVSLSNIVFSTAGNGALPMANGWTQYGHGYAPAEYSCKEGLVVVSGLVRGSQWGRPIGTLPAGCRPKGGTLIFTVNNHEKQARVDVLADGTIKWVAGGRGHGWVSLSGIVFATTGLKSMTLTGRWVNHGSGYAPAQTACVRGLTVAQGLITEAMVKEAFKTAWSRLGSRLRGHVRVAIADILLIAAAVGLGALTATAHRLSGAPSGPTSGPPRGSTREADQ